MKCRWNVAWDRIAMDVRECSVAGENADPTELVISSKILPRNDQAGSGEF